MTHSIVIEIWAEFFHAEALCEILSKTDGIEAEVGMVVKDGKRNLRLSLDPDKIELCEHFT